MKLHHTLKASHQILLSLFVVVAELMEHIKTRKELEEPKISLTILVQKQNKTELEGESDSVHLT